MEWVIYFKIKAEEAEKLMPKVPEANSTPRRGKTFVRRGDKVVML